MKRFDTDQAQQFVGPDLAPNSECLQKLCYQQTRLVGKELKLCKLGNFAWFFLFVFFFGGGGSFAVPVC